MNLRPLRLLLLLSCAIATLLADTAHAQSLPKRTLPELIQMAEKHAAAIDQAKAQVDLRKAQNMEAWSNYFPTGEVRFGIAPSAGVQCADLNNQAVTSPAGVPVQNCVNTIGRSSGRPLSVPGLGDITGASGEFNLNLTWPVFTFGKIEFGMKAAMDGIRAEEARVEAARAEVGLQATRAYWGLKAARAGLATATDARNDLASYVKKVEDDLDKPKPSYSMSDLTRLKVALAQVDVRIGDVERNVRIAEAGLEMLVGEPTDVDDAELEPLEIIDRPLDYYEQAALLHRPEVRALDAGAAAYQNLARVQLANLLPDLAFIGGISYRFAQGVDDPANAFLSHPNGGWGFYAGVGVREPLDLVQRYAHLAHARADQEGFMAQRKLSLTGIGFEIAQAWANLGEARRRLGAADHGMHLAQGWLNSLDQNLDSGAADARDLADAARNYYELRFSYYLALYDFNYDVAVLRRAAGIEVAK